MSKVFSRSIQKFPFGNAKSSYLGYTKNSVKKCQRFLAVIFKNFHLEKPDDHNRAIQKIPF